MNRNVRRHDGTGEERPSHPLLEAELSAHLFGSLHRADQRLKAEQYVRGLLALPGRKTLRNIAAQFDGAAAQQSVHHFITTSPWGWMPIRQALARHVQRTLAPEAWVIRSTVIPKVGPHSIGVDQQYLPHLGQAVNGQRALGTWLASGRSAVPVDWRLRLSDRWLADPLRRRAGIPSDVTAGSLEACVRESVAQVVVATGVRAGPVVVDVEGVDAVGLARHLSAAGLAHLVRVAAETPLRLDRGRLPKYGDRGRTAGELAAALTRLRHRVNPGDGPTMAATIPVLAPPGGRADGMLLVGEWRAGAADPRLWLTGGDAWLTGADAPSPATLLRLTRLPSVVARDFAAISEGVGMKDFAGRSFPGWHRHITLASVAHHVAAMRGARLSPPEV
ncbi:transposase [Streptomyces sp. NBC_01565]|uniref:IS701 family transposase n=1 Tax=Streptomyces sp. NBC_01565 TaxID=2975881 RepID=UPI002255EA83|nr:transposase [Streptomyces sp. NBC_01565]MCX4543089.1 transposase [Streptomyces sp. NBC_01565]